jgi:hypothetical protein
VLVAEAGARVEPRRVLLLLDERLRHAQVVLNDQLEQHVPLDVLPLDAPRPQHAAPQPLLHQRHMDVSILFTSS